MPAMEELRRRGVLDIPEPDPTFRELWEARTLTEAEVLRSSLAPCAFFAASDMDLSRPTNVCGQPNSLQILE
jgi:hypothetical protein